MSSATRRAWWIGSFFVLVLAGRFVWLDIERRDAAPDAPAQVEKSATPSIRGDHSPTSSAATAPVAVLAIEPAAQGRPAVALIGVDGDTRLVRVGDLASAKGAATIQSIDGEQVRIDGVGYTMDPDDAPPPGGPRMVQPAEYSAFWENINTALERPDEADSALQRTLTSLFVADQSLETIGLRKGDRIVAVNGRSLETLVQGMPVGSMLAGPTLRATVVRGAQQFDLEIRAEIE